MATGLRRFTISVSRSMEANLDKAKQDRYYRDTQNGMIKDLIVRGLASLDPNEASRNQNVRQKS